MSNIEFGEAKPLPEWERWKIEGLTGEDRTITTPDGRFYHVLPDEKFVLDPIRPEDDNLPQAFIEKDNKRIPFEEWAKEKTISE